MYWSDNWKYWFNILNSGFSVVRHHKTLLFFCVANNICTEHGSQHSLMKSSSSLTSMCTQWNKYVTISNSVYKCIIVSHILRKRCKRLIPCFFIIQELEEGCSSSLSVSQWGGQRVLGGQSNTEQAEARHQI